MPRKRQVQYDEPQKYDTGNGVRVTVEWPKGQRPKMQHLDTVVIIGDHVCGDVLGAREEGLGFLETDQGFMQHRRTGKPIERGGNFEVDPAKFATYKARLAAERGDTEIAPETAPPDYSPPVITNADINTAFEQRVKAETGFDISVPEVGKVVKIGGGG